MHTLESSKRKPFVSYESLYRARTRFLFSFISYEEEMDFFMNKWGARKVIGDIIIAYFVHELDNFEVMNRESRFF